MVGEIEPKDNIKQTLLEMEGGETDGEEESSQEGQMHGQDQGRQEVQKVCDRKREILRSSQEKIAPVEV
jgi:hypothetical protein